ncbi:hypothetical protein D9619_003738 [Psilocybe cf. subviscida]|uniref:F-box domain-containing protein n=1 Tax=Psilocybe cf. subviscida TaxID=2480587 RepID=A0A8H5AX08_9AGAR|nr:hypothetical protein D9619_003738 [Psilocybe cf. subviscida]
MKQARRKALSEANRKHDVLMNRLPLEICCEIFRQYLPPVEPVKPENCTPLILSAVSRSWRALCHSTPDLWTVMSLHVSIRDDSRSKTRAEVAQDWISRSGELPLTVIIDIKRNVDPQTAYFPAVIAAINQQSQRLTYLWMNISGNLLDLVNFNQHGAQKLLTLGICSLSAITPGRGPRFALCAPRFLDLRISSYLNSAINSSLQWFEIVPDNLIEAHLGDIYWEDVTKIIQNSPQLRSCSIHKNLSGEPPWNTWDNNPNQIKPRTIVHDALEFLHLNEKRHASVFALLMGLLTLPSLKELRITTDRSSDGFNIINLLDPLQAHIYRSSSRLSVLALCNLSFDNFEGGQLYSPISDLIRSVGPTIQHITIEPSVDTRFQDPARLIRSIIDCGTALPLLQSVQVYGPPKWWMHTLQALTTVGDKFYTSTGRPIRLILNTRKCWGWWANTLNELIGLQPTHPQKHDPDERFANNHDNLPPLSTEDVEKLVSSSRVHPPISLSRFSRRKKEFRRMSVCRSLKHFWSISNESNPGLHKTKYPASASSHSKPI